MEIIKNFKTKNLTKNSKSRKYTLYIAIKSAGRSYIISLPFRYNQC